MNTDSVRKYINKINEEIVIFNDNQILTLACICKRETIDLDMLVSKWIEEIYEFSE